MVYIKGQLVLLVKVNIMLCLCWNDVSGISGGESCNNVLIDL